MYLVWFVRSYGQVLVVSGLSTKPLIDYPKMLQGAENRWDSQLFAS
jgi:hypothetical protein